MRKICLICTLTAGCIYTSAAWAGGGTRVSVGLNFGGPAYYHPYPHYHAYYYPYPYYVTPAPVIYAPPPAVYVQPAPAYAPPSGYYPAPGTYSPYPPATYSQAAPSNYNPNTNYGTVPASGTQPSAQPPALLPTDIGRPAYNAAPTYNNGGQYSNPPPTFAPGSSQDNPPVGPPVPSRQ